MTATTLLMRFVGVTFNIYITNKIGSVGIGLFTLVMSVGAFAVTFATSGVNLAATRLTAEAMGKGAHGGISARGENSLRQLGSAQPGCGQQ